MQKRDTLKETFLLVERERLREREKGERFFVVMMGTEL